VLSDILQENPAEPLSVFVGWFAVLGPDDASQVDTSLLNDERASHFWDSDGEVSAFFSAHGDQMRLPTGELLWDAYFLFDADAGWGEAPPAVADWGAPVITNIRELTDQLQTMWADT